MVCIAAASAGITAQPKIAPPFRPEIPRVWQDAALEQLEVPVSQPAYSSKPVSEAYYYRIPVLPIYKSYPVYAPGRAPAGYLETLAAEA
jgi:hypothetical protein